jgi:hypothetical protein
MWRRKRLMPTDITPLDHPIDVMYLIHKAIRAEARQARQAAEHLEIGGNFKPFMDDFYRWATALGAHEDAEYHYVLPLIPDLPPARNNTIGHRALLAGLEDLQRCLHEELGRTIVIPRTRRQLCGKVIALLIAQADLLEEEEEALLPVIRHHIDTAAQLEMARHLLLDPDSEDPQWMLDWVAQHLTAAECHVLADLVARFAPVPPSLLQAADAERARQDAARAAAADDETAMTKATTADAAPIEVMYLLHKALNAEAWRTVSLTERLATGESLHAFRDTFASWEQTLTWHADQEDRYMTPLLPTSALARDNERSHQRLAYRMAEIRASLQELGAVVVTTRIRRRLFGQVVALRLEQEDHFEEEEDLVLPLMRVRLSVAQQGEIVQHLLHDPQAEDPGWVVAWLRHDLTETERHAVEALTTSWASPEAATVASPG